MKKDLLIAIAIALIVIGICFGLASIKLDLRPTPSKPFSTAAVGETVGQPSADGSQSGSNDNKTCRSESRIRQRQLELITQQEREVHRQRDESAECQEIKSRERPCEFFAAEHSYHFCDSAGCFS